MDRSDLKSSDRGGLLRADPESTRACEFDALVSINMPAPDRLQFFCSDGRWQMAAEGCEWPPQGVALIPASVAHALASTRPRCIRVQLPLDLEAWDWEAELARCIGGPISVVRYVMGGQPRRRISAVTLPLISSQSAEGQHLDLVMQARGLNRPLVLVPGGTSDGVQMRLWRSLSAHWRVDVRLSDALDAACADLGLHRSSVRLYGDGFELPDTGEQGWRPVTAVCIDLVGSTKLLNAKGAEAYASDLYAFHAACREALVTWGGSPEPPQGDGLMAYFGIPHAIEDSAGCALKAALELTQKLAGLGLIARIGVASGLLAVSGQRAVGSELHLAARLCAAAHAGQILVAASTQSRTAHAFDFEVRHAGNIKDFADLNEVFSLAGQRATGLKLSGQAEVETEFIGRYRELNTLESAMRSAASGRLQWCVVRGEAGIGKSRLLQEFALQLAQRSQRYLRLVGQVSGMSSPFAALIDGLQQHHQRLRSSPNPGLGGAELDALEQCLADLPLPQSRSGSTPLDLASQPRVSDVLLDLLSTAAGHSPFCLIIDDAHWLDPSSLDVLHRFRLASTDRPVLMVMGERAEEGQGSRYVGATTLQLEGLNSSEAMALIARLGSGIEESVRRQIVDRAEGIPLFLEECLRVCRSGELMDRLDVPATLQDLLMVRLDALGRNRGLAQLMSVLGKDFSAAQLEALLSEQDPFIDRVRRLCHLEALLQSGLVQAVDGPERSLRFKHALIRDTAYHSLWVEDRRRLHGLCAEVMKRLLPDMVNARPEQLADHLEAAGRWNEAILVWLQAARHAASRFAHQETLDLAHRGLALLQHSAIGASEQRLAVQFHLIVASAQIALQGYGSHAVESAYLSAERSGSLLDDTDQTLRVRLGLEACYVMRGDLQRAGDLAKVCVASTDWTLDSRLALQARWALANVQFHRGEWRAALAGFDECLQHYEPALYRRSTVQDPAVLCLGYSAWIHFELGAADEALRRIDRMVSLAEGLAHPFSLGVSHCFAASIKRLCGDSQAAWPHAVEALKRCQQGGFQVWLAHAWMVHGQLLADQGEIDKADAELDRGYAAWMGSGARISCATYLATRAEIHLRQGRAALALSMLKQGWRISEDIGEHYYQAELLRLWGLAHWQRGDTLEAEHYLKQALQLARRQDKPGLQLRCALSLGALRSDRGFHSEALLDLEGVCTTLTEHQSSRDWFWTQTALRCWRSGASFESGTYTPWEPLC